MTVYARSTNKIVDPWNDIQTVMVRNIPNNCSQQRLVREVEDAGFAGTFDFFYVPVDPHRARGANRGYAFINFIDPSTVHNFRLAFEGQQVQGFQTSKVIMITAATLQGYQANYDHFYSKKVKELPPDAQPLFLRLDGTDKANRMIAEQEPCLVTMDLLPPVNADCTMLTSCEEYAYPVPQGQVVEIDLRDETLMSAVWSDSFRSSPWYDVTSKHRVQDEPMTTFQWLSL